MGRLNDTFQAIKAGFQEQAPAEALEVMGRVIGQLAASGQAEKALGVGDRLPETLLPNPTGDMVNVNALLVHGPLVLSFYRGGW